MVLSNPEYSNAFMYIGASVEGRSELIEDGIIYKESEEL
jgi:hypothetical protein